MKKSLLRIFAVLLILGAIVYFENQRPVRRPAKSPEKAEVPIARENKNLPAAKELVDPQGYINTQKITIGELIGKKIILVDFWTYSCINCQRTTPYLNAWYKKYREKGLEIIGIHTPEFEFEKKYENVAKAVKNFGIEYPVVQDNEYATWQAYKNHYWPHKYLIDRDGFIVYDHIGEGGYEETEKKIQELLGELDPEMSVPKAVTEKVAQPRLGSNEVASLRLGLVDFSKVKSPEIYFGAWRNSALGNGIPGKLGKQIFMAPKVPKKNILYLDGEWNFAEQYVENETAPSKIIFRYEAKNVYMVASAKTPVHIKILRDGISVKEIEILGEELYQLIDGENYGEHILEIKIEGSGLRAFTFTFG